MQRWKPLLLAIAAVAGVWALAMAGYTLARNSRMTAAKVQSYVESVKLAQLSGAARTKAISGLIKRVNSLSPEERRKARFSQAGRQWFEQMTEQEKSQFVEQTMPTGFKQMLSSFEQLPEERRRRAIDDALKRFKEARKEAIGDGTLPPEASDAPPISRELEHKIRSIGLRTFYAESSAQTKAELAPVLEELQRSMESGRPFRQHP